MTDCERYEGIVFPEYYEDIFTEEDLVFRFRLIRTHIHPKLRGLITGCLEAVSTLLETDPYTFSKLQRAPRTGDGDPEQLRCALYGLQPNEVRGKGFPNLRSSSGRGRHLADFDLSFFADRDGLGLELHAGRLEELDLLKQVYKTYREQIDGLAIGVGDCDIGEVSQRDCDLGATRLDTQLGDHRRREVNAVNLDSLRS